MIPTDGNTSEFSVLLKDVQTITDFKQVLTNIEHLVTESDGAAIIHCLEHIIEVPGDILEAFSGFKNKFQKGSLRNIILKLGTQFGFGSTATFFNLLHLAELPLQKHIAAMQLSARASAGALYPPHIKVTEDVLLDSLKHAELFPVGSKEHTKIVTAALTHANTIFPDCEQLIHFCWTGEICLEIEHALLRNYLQRLNTQNQPEKILAVVQNTINGIILPANPSRDLLEEFTMNENGRSILTYALNLLNENAYKQLQFKNGLSAGDMFFTFTEACKLIHSDQLPEFIKVINDIENTLFSLILREKEINTTYLRVCIENAMSPESSDRLLEQLILFKPKPSEKVFGHTL